jgi:hypothetical protein
MPGGRNSSYPVRRGTPLVRDPQCSGGLSGLSASELRAHFVFDQAGAHPFLKTASYVAYRQARMETSANLSHRIGMGMYIPREPVTEEMRKDLIAGLYVSPLTPRYLKKLVIE